MTGPGFSCIVDGALTGGDCSEEVLEGQEVALVAAPQGDSYLVGWLGCDSTAETHAPGDTCLIAPVDDRAIAVRFERTVDLAVSISDAKDPVALDEDVLYTVTVQNLGGGAAENVVAASSLDLGTSAIETFGCSEDPAGLPTCDLGTIAGGESVQFTARLAVEPLGAASVSYGVAVSSDQLDPSPGNDSAEESTALDHQAPSVLEVRHGVEDAQVLEPCATVHGVPIVRLGVRFDEAMFDPAGDETPGDVTSPSSWRLVDAGRDRRLDTDSCLASAGDDELVSISSIAWDGATASLDPESPLEPGLYRLLACGEGPTALRDEAGNPLDGDLGAAGSESFQRQFRADPANLLASGHLDCDLGGWIFLVDVPEDASYSTADAYESPDSGSARLQNVSGSVASTLGQCHAMVPGSSYRLSARLNAVVDPGVEISAECQFFEDPDCTGASLDAEPLMPLTSYETPTDWLAFETRLAPPAGTLSGFCTLDLSMPEGQLFDFGVDAVELRLDNTLFADDFELGHFDRWSSEHP
ncbi:MAG: DUF11 domain-containing protein [Acidobacteriota bacterium]